MAKYLTDIPNYYLQNFVPGTTLDPKFKGKSFTLEELSEMKELAEEYVGKCGVRG